jgi:hypothetical protein
VRCLEGKRTVAADNLAPATARIGETAGIVWRYLAVSGPVSVNALARELQIPRDLLMQAIGWLAREDKLIINVEQRKRTLALKPN